jgi:hypothetical protein
LQELVFVDELEPGHVRVAAAGYGSELHLWYLGDQLDLESVRTRLQRATRLCLTVDQRMQWIGESREDAEAGLVACEAE